MLCRFPWNSHFIEMSMNMWKTKSELLCCYLDRIFSEALQQKCKYLTYVFILILPNSIIERYLDLELQRWKCFKPLTKYVRGETKRLYALLCSDLCLNYLSGTIPMEWASLRYLTSMLALSVPKKTYILFCSSYTCFFIIAVFFLLQLGLR